MVHPAYEARVYLPRIGGVMSSNDMRREAYTHGTKVLYRTVPTYKCKQLESVSYYDFESVVFKVVKSRGAYRIIVDKDETRQDITIWVEGIGVYEGRNLGGTFKQFLIPRRSPPKKTVKPVYSSPKKNVKPVSSPPKRPREHIYRTSHRRPIKRDKERVAVSVLTLKRPAWLKQCLESILQNKTPLKIIITNQADYSQAQMEVINQWKDRPYVHYRVNDPPKWPGASRAAVFRLAKKAGYEFIITLDDDCVLLPNAIDKLVNAADKHQEFYAISGYIITPHNGTHMLGGLITVLDKKHFYRNHTLKRGVREVHYISNGFRLVRLEPLVVPDVTYTIGLTDFDWSMKAKAEKLRLAVCGDAGAYHKFMLIDGKPTNMPMSWEYRNIRRNTHEILKMKRKFAKKWGVELG